MPIREVTPATKAKGRQRIDVATTRAFSLIRWYCDMVEDPYMVQPARVCGARARGNKIGAGNGARVTQQHAH